jgi:hypothetical protein
MLRPVRLRISKARGLLVSGWVGGGGPYVFAIDTGAGMNIITKRVVEEVRLRTNRTEPTKIAGVTGEQAFADREAVLHLALGSPSNNVAGGKSALVVQSLAPGIDGILDPTDIYSPYGYSIDMPGQRIEAIDSAAVGPPAGTGNGEGATVPWLRLDDSLRPFVRLGDGRLALVDTGSSFGLAVNGRNALIVGHRGAHQNEPRYDIGGGTVSSRRVAPTTISIGSLVLQRVPTDILFGIEDTAPVILGRDLLYPFKITFDSQRHLIEFVTTAKS